MGMRLLGVSHSGKKSYNVSNQLVFKISWEIRFLMSQARLNKVNTDQASIHYIVQALVCIFYTTSNKKHTLSVCKYSQTNINIGDNVI